MNAPQPKAEPYQKGTALTVVKTGFACEVVYSDEAWTCLLAFDFGVPWTQTMPTQFVRERCFPREERKLP